MLHSGFRCERRASGFFSAGLAVVLLLAACGHAPVPPSKPAPTPAPAAPAAPPATTGDESHAAPAPQAFRDWLAGVRAEALRAGIAPETLDRAFRDLAPSPRVIELDRRQPEFTSTFWGYMDRAVSDARVDTGREMLARHAALLSRVSRDSGVPPDVLVAFWGLETNYGGTLGGHNVIQALATLAWDGRRGAFFRTQLLAALRILDEGHITPSAMQGSWAGAMGQMQFMPTTFAGHAVDYDGDGRKDIWTNLADAFGSAGAFLSDLGWRPDERWGRQVVLPQGFDYARAGLDSRLPLEQWSALGVRRVDGSPLPVVAGMTASLVVPAGHKGPAFLVYDNFRIIMRWNNSTLYALAIGHLSDRIAGAGPLVGAFDRAAEPLRLSEVREIQQRLNALGYDAGPVDGLLGPGTRGAIRRFQADRGMVADGHADTALLWRLRRAAG